MSYEGPERRKENLELEARIRDLEESDRSGIKSRELMHIQLSHLNTKMDLVLSRMDEKNEECAIHHTKTAILEQKQVALEKAIDDIFKKDIAPIEEEQLFLRRFVFSALVTALGSLVASIWGMKH